MFGTMTFTCLTNWTSSFPLSRAEISECLRRKLSVWTTRVWILGLCNHKLYRDLIPHGLYTSNKQFCSGLCLKTSSCVQGLSCFLKICAGFSDQTIIITKTLQGPDMQDVIFLHHPDFRLKLFTPKSV